MSLTETIIPQIFMKRFGEKLRILRLNRGLTLAEMAQKLGYSTHAYLSEIETGRKEPNLKLVLAVANMFHCTTDELLKDDLDLILNKNSKE